jgi:hypothetical protein
MTRTAHSRSCECWDCCGQLTSKAPHKLIILLLFMYLCRVLDACGLCVLPSEVAALTSLTKLCVHMPSKQHAMRRSSRRRDCSSNSISDHDALC